MEENKRRILMVNLPYAGHTNPSLGLVRCLVAAGHEVDYIQAESFRERVEASSARFVPYDVPPNTCVSALNEVLNWGAAYRTVRRIGANYDCLIYELLFFPGKALAAELGIPSYRLISTFALNRRLLRVLGKTGGPYLTALFRSERLCTALSRLFLSKFLLRDKNLAEALVREAPPHNFIYTLRDFQPEEACFPETNYHFVGPAIEDRAEEPFSFGESGNPVVYISFGTLIHADKRFWRKLIAAFAGKRVEVVCSVGSEKLARARGLAVQCAGLCESAAAHTAAPRSPLCDTRRDEQRERGALLRRPDDCASLRPRPAAGRAGVAATKAGARYSAAGTHSRAALANGKGTAPSPRSPRSAD